MRNREANLYYGLRILTVAMLLRHGISEKLTYKNTDDTCSERASRAAYHADEGISLATKGQYETALAHFRAATRVAPTAPKYWSDLGVTEMRMGMYVKALRRFLKALGLDASYRLAQENIDELQRFMDAGDFNTGMEGDVQHMQEHYREQLPRVDAKRFKDMTIAADNGSTNSILNGPFVIERGLQEWGWNLDAFSTTALQQRHGDSRVDFYPHNMNDESVHPYFSTLRAAIDQLTDPQEIYTGVDASEPGTYIQWNLDAPSFDSLLHDAQATLPALLDDRHWTDRCFLSADALSLFNLQTHWKMVMIAESPAGMFNHKDTLQTSSWQVQLVGRKRWHICPPSQDPYLYKAGEVNTFNPDYIRYPLFRQARCYEDILQPGDVVYYPKNYWHQTLNLDTPTVSLTGTLATGNCYREVFNELKIECEGKGRIFAPNDELCANIDRCASHLENHFQSIDNDVLVDHEEL